MNLSNYKVFSSLTLIITTIFGLLVTEDLLGQIIQNRGFENWAQDSAHCPVGFHCTNQKSFGIGIEPVKRTTIANRGKYGLSLETYFTANDTFIGSISNGDIDSQSGGVAYSQRPDSIDCYAYYDVKPGDTAVLIASFRRAGTIIGTSTKTFIGQQRNYAWFKFGIDWQTTPGIKPDSMILSIASSNAITKNGVAHGSTLVIDNIRFLDSGKVLKQQPPNVNFEDWTTLQNEKPNFWSSPLDRTLTYKYNLVNKLTIQSTVHTGSTSIEIQSDVINGDTIVGYLKNYNASNPGGYSYVDQIDTLQGFYHFYSPGLDSATVYVVLHNETQKHVSEVQLPPVTGFTEFNLPINCPFVPDSIKIGFVAGIGINPKTVVSGSTLRLDQLEFNNCKKTVSASGFQGKTVFCSDSSNRSFSVNQMSNAHSFNWQFPDSVEIISKPLDSNHVIVSFSNKSHLNDSIIVAPIPTCGISLPLIKPIKIIHTPIDVYADGGYGLVVASVFAEKYYWFINDIFSPKDTLREIYNAKDKRWYKVVASNDTCISDTSIGYYHNPGLVRENKKEFDVSIFPNPTKAVIELNFLNKPQEFSTEVFSILGELQLETNNKTELDLSKLPNGAYNVRIQVEEQVIYRRIIKQ